MAIDLTNGELGHSELAQSIREEIDRLRASHDAEVRALRNRIHVLEQALAEAHRSRSGSHLPTAAEIEAARQNGDAAAAWQDDTATFEEKVAARAFFLNDGGDMPSRKWLLDEG